MPYVSMKLQQVVAVAHAIRQVTATCLGSVDVVGGGRHV